MLLNQSLVVVILTLGVVVTTSSATLRQRDQPRTQTYRYFDNYLVEFLSRQISTPVTARNDTAGSSGDRVTDLDILGYFRDVPRRHWSCCMLGKLAGDKGFHCQATFYAARIARRNVNRAHNRKMLFHGPEAIANWGRDIMTTFSRCISNYEEQFHRCCQVATVEVTERRRWQSFRQHTRI